MNLLLTALEIFEHPLLSCSYGFRSSQLPFQLREQRVNSQHASQNGTVRCEITNLTPLNMEPSSCLTRVDNPETGLVTDLPKAKSLATWILLKLLTTR